MQGVGFELAWWRHADEVVEGTVDLPVTADDVRAAFGLGPHDYPGDCLEVTAAHVPWLEKLTGMTLDLGTNGYGVMIFAR